MSTSTGTTIETTIADYYTTILARTGSAAEIQSWVSVVDSGALTLGQVESAFIASPEAQQNVVPIVEIYQAELGRAPDAAGLAAWVGAEESGTSLATIAADIANSAEGQAFYGAPTTVNEAFLTALYQTVLGRAPDAAGLNAWLNSGLTPAQIEYDFATSAEAVARATPAADAFLASVSQGGAYAGSLYGAGSGGTFTLTTGADNIALTGNNNTVNGTANGSALSTPATFTAGDTITAAAGSTGNVLNLADIDGSIIGSNGIWDPTSLEGVTVSGIQTVNLNSEEAVSVNTANSPEGFGGLTNLNVNFNDYNAGEDSTITAAGTTAISAQDSNFGYGYTDSVEGGSNINYVANADYDGTINIGDTTAPTGTISVTANVLPGQYAGGINVNGGTTVTVTENGTGSGNIQVNGGTLTTSVTVNQTAPTSSSNAYVEIYDANSTLATPKAGTITDVSLSNYNDGAYIEDNALANLTLAGTGDGVEIDTNGFASPSTTLNLTLNGLTDSSGITDDYGELKTVNITTGGTVASSLGGIYNNAVEYDPANLTTLTTLTVTGSQSLSIGSEIASLTTVAVSGGAGLQIALGPNTAFTSTSTGTDVVTISGPATQTITGNGTANEELVWDGAAAPANTAALGNASGFKVLGIGSDVVSGTFDMSKLTGFTGFDVEGNTNAGTITLSNANAGSPLAIDGTTNGTLVYQTADSSGATDSLGITLGAAANTAGFDVNALTAEDSQLDGIGTLTITSNASGANAFQSISTLTDSSLSTLNVAGTGGLLIGAGLTTDATSLTVNGTSTGTLPITILGGVNDTALTTLTVTGSDAVTIGGLTTSAASVALTNSGSSTLAVGILADANLTSLTLNGSVAADLMGDTVATGVTVNGATDNSAVAVDMSLSGAASGKTDSFTLGNGTDSVQDLSTAGATVNITVGNGGNSTTANLIAVGDANSTITAGSGVNNITVGNGTNTITVTSGNDAITAGNGNNTINAGSGNDTITAGNGNNTITAGSGTDNITVGTGQNSITFGAHSATTIDNVSVAAATSTAIVPSATISGLNANGADTITFLGSSAAGPITTFTTAQLDAFGATTLAGAVADVLSGTGGDLAANGIAEFQFQNNTYFVDQNSTAGTAFGVGDAVVKLAGLDTFTTNTNATGGVLHLVG